MFSNRVRVAIACGLAVLFNAWCAFTAASAEISMQQPVRFGVLGDSDSHSFHDSVLLSDPKIRGGEYRATTYQWTEVLARLRSQQIDMGEWNIWGMRGRIAAISGFFGWEDRAPRKQDYRYNFAISGAKCDDLTQGMSRQTQRLVYLMDREPASWANGIITIRIGINSIGTHEPLARFARSGLDADAQSEVTTCANYVRDAVALIRANHRTTRIVLIGILNNSDFIPWIDHWKTSRELNNIAAVMDAYDAALKQIAIADSNIAFWDDRAWFAEYFGDRDDHGSPRYHSTKLTGPMSITYTQGDAPTNAILTDNHAGTVWNGLWARDLLEMLNRRFGYHFQSITTKEIAELTDPEGRFGINAHPDPRFKTHGN